MQLTGANILIETLIEQGTDTVFGYPGGAVLNIYDALYEHADKIHHVLASHEQGAAHAADGYARATGKTGVVIATSGPGASNLVTGIATAYMDSVPMVAITGNVPLDLIGRDSFQEIDITGITMPITKHNYMVKDIAELADTVREAFLIANSGRPGPVLIDIPKDITAKTAEFVPGSRFIPRENPSPSQESIDACVQMLSQCKRPLIYAGGGVVIANASEELMELSNLLKAPVSLSIMGITALPNSFPRNLGMIGMHGTPASNKAALECDLLLCIGARFSDRVAGDRKKFAYNAKIIHIDIDPSEHSKNVLADLAVTGDAKTVLSVINERLEQKTDGEWAHELLRYRALNPLPNDNDAEVITTPAVLAELKDIAGDDAIIVTDVGQHQMKTAQYYKFSRPRSFLSSCGLGTMGYGLGAAIGAKTAYPDRPVVLITGDGSFHMNMNEMACAVTEELGIVVVVMNNSVLGMVRQWQRLFYGSRFSSTSINRKTDYPTLARAFGAVGWRAEKMSQLRPALEKAFAAKGPSIVECVIDQDENVFPIIPPGGSGKDMIFFDS